MFKGWSIKYNDELKGLIRKLENELESMDEKEVGDQIKKKVTEKLVVLYKKKVSYIKQKLRIKWDFERDRNSQFLDHAVKINSSHNQIQRVE